MAKKGPIVIRMAERVVDFMLIDEFICKRYEIGCVMAKRISCVYVLRFVWVSSRCPVESPGQMSGISVKSIVLGDSTKHKDGAVLLTGVRS
jgi:hypothetical protein